jgi:NAD(P)-dependent dehydrogenase (short-subunit alcohol dehydrogenase family)
VDEFGRLDGLVNNAALFVMARPHEQDPEEFRRVIEVNVVGTAYCGIHALKHMVAQDSGSLINISSGASWGSPAQGAYGASKGAVSSLTYSWARDVAGTGVRVNSVAPNAMTRMAEIFEAFYGDAAPGQNVDKDPMLNAPAVVYLLSDRSIGLNGQVIRVDGEELALMTHPAVLSPSLYSPAWTAESVAEAFDETLTAQQLPLGISRVDGPFSRG